MKLRNELLGHIMPLRTFDTHTHLVGGRLAARGFWDIGEYFWLLRELRSAGYPANADQLPDDERYAAWFKAYQANRTTSMAWCVRTILADLYGQRLESVEDLYTADAAIRARAADEAWPRTVCDRLGLRTIVTNVPADAPFAEVPDVALCLPRLETELGNAVELLDKAVDRAAVGEAVVAELARTLGEYAAAGYPGVMTSEAPFRRLTRPLEVRPPHLGADSDREALAHFVLHALCAAARTHGLCVQLFLGIESHWPGGAVAVRQGDRVLLRHGLFAAYEIPFELVMAAEAANYDVIQAARVFENVHVGGLWWYNFRASSYRAAMQLRLEGLPPGKCNLLAGDARCIEWAYGKTALVKTWLAEFLAQQIDAGWLDLGDALWVASEWLHDGAARLYRTA